MNKGHLKYNQPKIDFQDARRAWFDYGDKSYSVATAPTSVFRAAVLEKAPAWRWHAEYKSFFKARELDLLDRWYLLCDLIRIDKPITLHKRESESMLRYLAGQEDF